MTTTQSPQVIVQPMPFLPAPRVPLNRFPMHESVAAVVGDLAAPLAAVEQALAEAELAVMELTACRPGVNMPDGERWRRAVADDRDAYAAGTRPKKWKAQAMLEGDLPRWALAQAATQAASLVVARSRNQLDQDQIAARAVQVADAKARAWAESAKAAWDARDDKLEALQNFRIGEERLREYRAAHRVMLWAHGIAERPLDAYNTAAVALLPGDPVGRGHWLSVGLVLEPDTVWLELPTDVDWPEGGGELMLKAIPESGDRLVSLRERGYHATER